MNFPPHWACGRHEGYSCWRWSHDSLEAAQALANRVARELAARLRGGRPSAPARHYYGTDRPLREPVLREFRDGGGELSAVVTRNSYGCLVLNTARMMFVDVDAPVPEPESAGGFLKRLFGRQPPRQTLDVPEFETRTLNLARAWAENHARWGWRVYRTKAGLRLLATHELFEPDGGEAEVVFNTFETDPLYRRLCRTQKCFRARLTPKPWRCGSAKPPGRWPHLTAGAQRSYESWEQRYRSDCVGWATCEFIAQIGNPEPHGEIRPLLVVHDETSRATSKLPLA